MANVKLIFYGAEGSEGTELSCFANSNNQIFIEIDSTGGVPGWIVLDKSTAIKFSKNLRTEISKLESEVKDV